jgi:hypothetical protein
MKTLQFAKMVSGLGLALGVAACSDSGPEVTQLTSANSAAVAAAAVQAMNLSLDGLDSDAIDITGFGGGFGAPVLAAIHPNGVPAAFNAPDGCPSFSPDPPVDTDGDGVPDNALFTFDPQFCTLQGEGGTMLITGSIRVSDPASVTIGADVAFNEVTFAQFENGSTEPLFGLIYDGTRSLRGQPTSLTLDENFSVFVQAGAQQAGFSNEASLSFTPTGGATIDFDLDLPNGDVDWNGTFSVQSPEGFFVLMVQTVQTLSYDAACLNPESGEGSIVAGVLSLAASSSDGAGVVQITFNGCGVEPTVEFAGSTA